MALKATGATAAFRTGLFNGNRYMAAFSAQGVEQTWGSYARRLAVLANWSPVGRNYQNNAALNFVNPTTVGAAITHWGMYDALNGGDLMLDFELAAALGAPAIGANTGFDANAIGWGFSGAFTQEGSRRACSEGILAGSRYLSLHTGPPGTDGDNALAGEDPIEVTIANWSLDTNGGNRRARNNTVLTYGASTTDLPVSMYVALRVSDASDSPVLWADQFDVTPDDPELGDTLQFTVNQLSVLLSIDG